MQRTNCFRRDFIIFICFKPLGGKVVSPNDNISPPLNAPNHTCVGENINNYTPPSPETTKVFAIPQSCGAFGRS